jgi:molybdate transport system substrate-binding protein
MWYRFARLMALASMAMVGAMAHHYWSAQAAEKRVVRVAAAADLKFALDEIREAFQRQHPSIEVVITYGSSGNFYSQLANRAPFDMFLSADLDYPRRLIQQNLALAESEFPYAVGSIVLWVQQTSPIAVEKLGIQALLDPSARKIAIANPRHAPYGRAAEAAMKNLGVFEKVQGRLVLGENITQTAQFVESGAADIGIISRSLAIAPALRDKGRSWEVPSDAYPRLEQGGVILSWAEDRAAADALRSFVLGDDGKSILGRYGFHPAGSKVE